MLSSFEGVRRYWNKKRNFKLKRCFLNKQPILIAINQPIILEQAMVVPAGVPNKPKQMFYLRIIYEFGFTKIIKRP